MGGTSKLHQITVLDRFGIETWWFWGSTIWREKCEITNIHLYILPSSEFCTFWRVIDFPCCSNKDFAYWRFPFKSTSPSDWLGLSHCAIHRTHMPWNLHRESGCQLQRHISFTRNPRLDFWDASMDCVGPQVEIRTWLEREKPISDFLWVSRATVCFSSKIHILSFLSLHPPPCLLW